MTNGIPKIKYHFLVLCRKVNIPIYTPTLPKKTAMKNNNPSEILVALFFLDFNLSSHIIINAIRFIVRKKIIRYVEKLFMFF